MFCEHRRYDYSWIDYATLEGFTGARTWRPGAPPRAGGALRPASGWSWTNWAEVFGSATTWSTAARPPCRIPTMGVHEGAPERRRFHAGPRGLDRKREDFEEVPPKGWATKLRSQATGCAWGYDRMHGLREDAEGRVAKVLATVVPDTKSGTPGADSVKGSRPPSPGGVCRTACRPRRCACGNDRLFTDAPARRGRQGSPGVHPDSLKVVNAYVEPSLAAARPDGNSSSNASATSWPTARTTRPAGPCSTASRGSRTAGASRPRPA